MVKHPSSYVTDFEQAVCEYTGAPYVVAVNSCSMALLLAVAWHVNKDWSRERPAIEIPKRTYCSVPMSICHAGGRPTFRDEEWKGFYQLKPLPVWDSARWFTFAMWSTMDAPSTPPIFRGGMVCTSHHSSKTLGDTQGGCILHDNPEADAWFRAARFDGRHEGVAPIDDDIEVVGWHCYMSGDVAARLLWKLHALPKHNDPLPNDNYPDLSQIRAFQ